MTRSWILVPRTFVATIFVMFWGAAMALGTLIVSIRDPEGTRGQRLQILFSRGILLVCGVRVTVSGREKLPAGAVVLMANHRSHFDVVALMAALPDLRLRWVAKKELGRIPIFGWGLRAGGHILIDRRNRSSAAVSLNRARRALERGGAVVIFPEGTRSFDARLLPFKRGGFHIAVQAALPIVPVAVEGSESVLAKRRWVIRPGRISVRILDPVPTSGRTPADVAGLAGAVRARLEAALGVPPAATS